MSNPLSDEINPNEPILGIVREHWHKVAAFILFKLQGPAGRVDITLEDIERMNRLDLAIMIQEKSGENQVCVYLIPRAEGEKVAREHGGMPV